MFDDVASALHLSRAVRMMFRAGGMALLALLPAGPAHAADPEPVATSELVDALVRCRAVSAADERLSCFDRAAASLDEAVRSRAVMVVDREKVEKARREEFGQRRKVHSLPTLEAPDGTELQSLDSVVRAASDAGDGNWTFILADGSVWRQTDGVAMGLPPRTGDKVTIVRASFGTYKLRLNKQPAVRVRRLS